MLKNTRSQRPCLPARRPHSLFWLVWLACWVSAGLAPAPAQAAQDLISARAWLSDPSGELGPDQVRQRDWTPYSGRLRQGFTRATTWVRLTIAPQPDMPGDGSGRPARLVLRIQPGQLDEIALFDPRRHGQPPQLTGDRHDWRLGEYRSFNHSLVMDAPTAPIQVLLRLRTTSHHGLDIEAMSWDLAQQRDGSQQLGLGAYFAFMLMMLAWSGWSWWAARERVVGAFFVQQAVSTLFVLSWLGIFRVYLSDWLPAPLLDAITSWMFPLAQTATVWFHWHFLREFNPPRLGLRCLEALMALLPVECLLLLAGQTRAALQLNVVVTSLTPLLLLVMAWRMAPPAPQETRLLSRRQLLTVYGLMLLTLGSATLPALGWLPSAPWGSSGLPLYAFVSALLIAGALQARAKNRADAHRQALTALTQSQRDAARERARREEQEQFLAMLTHELTTPLSVASLALSKLSEASAIRTRAYRAVDSMRAIIERVSLADRLDRDNAMLRREDVDVTTLLRELREQFNVNHPTQPRIALQLEGLLPWQTDRQLLAIVMSNLMDNALKYGAGEVTVAGCTQDRGQLPGLLLAVRNAVGPSGRPDPAHLFEKYHRGRAAMSKPGTGLGLYLSALIAKRLGGELHHPPEADEVCFELWLPA